MSTIRIVLAGAGSGGHLFPLVTVAKKIKEQLQNEDRGAQIIFIGPKGKMEEKIMNENQIPQKNILCGKLRRYFSLAYFSDAIKFPIGIIQSLWHLFWFMPDVVFAKGGFASVPVVISAKILFIPVVIHESDAMPGLANKFLGAIADKIAINFERAVIYFPPHKTFLSGIPVKEEAINGSKEKARAFLGMHKEVKPVVLFLGGSQGAKAINDKILFNIDALIKKYQIVHQIGEKNFEKVSKEVERKGYKISHSDYYPLGFVGKEIGDIYALADVIVSRAGATNIAEIGANGKPAIFVPIKKGANDHQRINAYEVARVNAGFVLEEDNFSLHLLNHFIDEILTKEDLRIKISQNIQKFFYYPDANEKIADEVLLFCK